MAPALPETRTVRSVPETQAFARELARRFGPGFVWSLSGDLGAGKTCFVQGLCDGLGIEAAASSPTFAIAHEYGASGPGPRLVHLDLYRLSGPDELETVGWDDMVDSGDTMAVEWPDRAGPCLPADRTVRVEIAHGASEDERVITVCPPLS
ncbi:MAG: tRNA (adenosine(37)-N6)-threonylcarbamoyltransferase complex ATPase subunit type 1 TsaE [Kiritimatiellae bacterium]|nr:tRNA (adenosine(37)-N6)-threonylcarbamoyltransferase complex ATPase subunit type 1 TsaE [Kiritimatiellia bacterium]